MATVAGVGLGALPTWGTGAKTAWAGRGVAITIGCAANDNVAVGGTIGWLCVAGVDSATGAELAGALPPLAGRGAGALAGVLAGLAVTARAGGPPDDWAPPTTIVVGDPTASGATAVVPSTSLGPGSGGANIATAPMPSITPSAIAPPTNERHSRRRRVEVAT
jgi:hypothetical protein